MKKDDVLNNKDSEELFKTFLNLKNIDDAKSFLRDLLTEKEIIECSNRWKVVRMLDKQKSYMAINAATGMSSTTIARIHKWMKEGKGGYSLMLKRIKNNE
ncbi:MAG: YerC/YecD family TrpR-related protein [bacterium]